MKIPEFDIFLENQLNHTRTILSTKSADYSGANNDKLYNFKLQAAIDGVTPVEALRGNWLKHRASIVQGLNDLQNGKIRSLEWWEEKLTDDRNYNLLLHALLYETYFQEKEKILCPCKECGKDMLCLINYKCPYCGAIIMEAPEGFEYPEDGCYEEKKRAPQYRCYKCSKYIFSLTKDNKCPHCGAGNKDGIIPCAED